MLIAFLATIWVQAQATYANFAVANCTGEVSTAYFHKGSQSYKTLGSNTEINPQLTITINGIANWTTITKASLWVYTTAGWNNGQVAINATTPGWKSQIFSAVPNSWSLIEWDFSATPFAGGNTWGQFVVQYYNKSADLYYDEITFYNAAGDVVYEIDASDVSVAPTSIMLSPAETEVMAGKVLPLSVTTEPGNAGTGCNYSSLDEAVATVDGFGKVTAVGAGTTHIIAVSKLDAEVKDTAVVTVTDPVAANSSIYASFENGLGNYDGAWASWVNNAVGPVPTVEIVDKPVNMSKGLASGKALKVSNFWQWGAITFKAFDANKVNAVKFKVYSETEVPDLKFELGLNNGTSSTVNTSAAVLPAGTWTEYTFPITAIQSADRQFFIKLASSGSATAAYTLYFDEIQLLAGSNFIPVSSFSVNGLGAVSEITTDGGTLQMEAGEFLPVDASNQSVRWVISSDNDPVIASITSDGLLTGVRNGTVTVRGIADIDGAYAEKEIVVSNQFTNLTASTPVARVLDAPNVTSEDDFSVNLTLSYDVDSIYMVFDVKDDSVVSSGANSYTIDNIEVYLDMTNSKNPLWPRGAGWPNTSFVAGDYQLRLVPEKAFSANNSLKGVTQTYMVVPGGYQFKLNIALDSLSADFDPALGTKIGFDVLASDNDSVPYYRDQLSWNATSTMLWNDPSYWGTIQFADAGTFYVIEDLEAPAAPENVLAAVTDRNVSLTWDAATDNIVVQEYIVKKDGIAVDTIPAKNTANTFAFSDLSIGNHVFAVTAVDPYGNKSVEAESNTALVVIWTEYMVENALDAPNVSSATDFTVMGKARYDADSIYLVFDVQDDVIINTGANNYTIDNIEVYFDMTNSKNPLWPRGAGWPNTSFVAGDYQLRLVPGNAWTANNTLDGVTQTYTEVEGGYQFLLNIALDSLLNGFTPELGTLIGFDVLASDNDNDPDYRDQVSFSANSTMLWNDPSYWGTVRFEADGIFSKVEDTEAPTAPANVVAAAVVNDVTLTWDAAVDNIVVESYIIYQGETALDTITAKASANTFAVNDLENGSYTFSVVAVDMYGNVSLAGVSNELTILIDGVKGVKASLSIGPNPVSELLNISSSETISNITVYDISGKLVNRVIVNDVSSVVRFAGFNKGIYLVKIQTGNTVITKQIVKE
jgi:hypothetical protein